MTPPRISIICKYQIAFTHITKYGFQCVSSDMGVKMFPVTSRELMKLWWLYYEAVDAVLTVPVLAPPLTSSHCKSLKRAITPWSLSRENPNCQAWVLISAVNKIGNLGKPLLQLCTSVLRQYHGGSVSLLCSVQISPSTISPVRGQGLYSILYRAIF